MGAYNNLNKLEIIKTKTKSKDLRTTNKDINKETKQGSKYLLFN